MSPCAFLCFFVPFFPMKSLSAPFLYFFITHSDRRDLSCSLGGSFGAWGLRSLLRSISLHEIFSLSSSLSYRDICFLPSLDLLIDLFFLRFLPLHSLKSEDQCHHFAWLAKSLHHPSIEDHIEAAGISNQKFDPVGCLIRTPFSGFEEGLGL